jgi:glycosyltransferase involved in cell wall biosynthesis
LKLLITVPFGERLGGAENMLWTFLRHVDRAHTEPKVVFFEAGPFERELAEIGIETAVVPAGRLRQPKQLFLVVRALAKLMRQEQPDLMLNWMPKTHLYGACAAMLAGMTNRLVWWQHGIPSGHWLDRLASLLPARAVGCSSRHSAAAQERVWPRRATFVVHPGIDEPKRPTPQEVAALRRRLAIPEGDQVVGIVGRLQPWKGQDKLLRAVVELRRRGHDVHAVIVGGVAYNLSPEYEPYLRTLVSDLGVERVVHFTGQVADPAPFICLMDVLVNASDAEPFGIVLLQAMALEVAVVAVDRAGPAEIIEAGRSGLLVRSADPNVLADGLEKLFDAALRRRLGENGRRRFEAHFTAKRMTSELERHLAALVP